jgi:uncharacterized phage-associated protein
MVCSHMIKISTAPYDAREVANFLLDYADARQTYLTQISLLKIIYFCHGWYLFYNKKPLVKNEFEAWENGPVVRVVRDAFKAFGGNRITSRAEKFDLYTGKSISLEPNLEQDDQVFIKQIFEAYYVHGPWKLRDMTHERGSPWDKLWNSDRPIARFGLRIRNDEILEHFTLKARQESVL